MLKFAPLSMLTTGTKLGSPIHDQQNRLLLGAGIEITQELLSHLHKRGLQNVVVEENDWIRLSAFEPKGEINTALPNHVPAKSDLHTTATDELDESLRETSNCDIAASEQPFAEQVQSHGASSYQPDKMNRLLDHHQQTVDQVAELFGQLAEGSSVESQALQDVARETVMQAVDDMDLFVCMGINPVADNSLFAHSTNVATLAIALGATLGLDEESLCDLGAGCLIHDAGMQHIDERVYLSKHVLSPVEFLEITKHPIISADLLYNKMSRVPVAVRMLVYQMHERCNGTGYPRGWKADQIHPLAKIAAVADAYVALVSPRPHRHAMLPYFAMKEMLEEVKRGLYDPTVVRGLLHTISLFPIGSYCELSDARLAKVIRTNGEAYDRPIVEAWRRPHLTAEPEVLDLVKENIAIVKPLTRLNWD
jgi:HD-GYP domain-containing protein (c-di-GMP phosphodiesterase class II)